MPSPSSSSTTRQACRGTNCPTISSRRLYGTLTASSGWPAPCCPSSRTSRKATSPPPPSHCRTVATLSDLKLLVICLGLQDDGQSPVDRVFHHEDTKKAKDHHLLLRGAQRRSNPLQSSTIGGRLLRFARNDAHLDCGGDARGPTRRVFVLDE